MSQGRAESSDSPMRVATIEAITVSVPYRHREVSSVVARDGVTGQPRADEAGGLSGRPLRARSTAVVARLAKALDGALPIIGVGGILSGADAKEKIVAGATLIQIYTGLIYRGPDLVAECARALAAPAVSSPQR